MTALTIKSSWAAEGRSDEWTGTIEQAGMDASEDRDVLLNQIFRTFNRVDIADGEFLKQIGYELPSLSSGDEITIGIQTYRVESTGFSEV